MEEKYEQLADSISEKNYGVMDDFLSVSEVNTLAAQLHVRQKAGDFSGAGIGQGAGRQVQTHVRGDQICWLDSSVNTPSETDFTSHIDELIQYFNRTCYLGLQDAEMHYASYPIGSFYKRHLDSFRYDSRRKLSVICYLNSDWQLADGGELVIYGQKNNAEEAIKISPLGGRLVCFEAERLEHEVLPSTRERLSLTGWLRR
jgi:SM-20-related protein